MEDYLPLPNQFGYQFLSLLLGGGRLNDFSVHEETSESAFVAGCAEL
jgi:hypothetical protein